MTDVKFSDFPLGNTATFPQHAALQAGANVRLDEASLAYSIAFALNAVARPVVSISTFQATNLTGTNTGDQVAAGVPYTPTAPVTATNVQTAIDALATRAYLPSDLENTFFGGLF